METGIFRGDLGEIMQEIQNYPICTQSLQQYAGWGGSMRKENGSNAAGQQSRDQKPGTKKPHRKGAACSLSHNLLIESKGTGLPWVKSQDQRCRRSLVSIVRIFSREHLCAAFFCSEPFSILRSSEFWLPQSITGTLDIAIDMPNFRLILFYHLRFATLPFLPKNVFPVWSSFRNRD